MQEYVLGFAFTPQDNRGNRKVALIQKLKPEWQKRKFNGIGGKVEPSDEDIYAAMSREFQEETGVCINKECWDYVGEMHGALSWSVKVFTTTHPDVVNVRTVEQERVLLVDPIKEIDYIYEKGISNVPWLIFSCMDVDMLVGRSKFFVEYGGN